MRKGVLWVRGRNGGYGRESEWGERKRHGCYHTLTEPGSGYG